MPGGSAWPDVWGAEPCRVSFCPSLAAKVERLKQAKAEAEREIESYKVERETEYKRKVRPAGVLAWRRSPGPAPWLGGRPEGVPTVPLVVAQNL